MKLQGENELLHEGNPPEVAAQTIQQADTDGQLEEGVGQGLQAYEAMLQEKFGGHLDFRNPQIHEMLMYCRAMAEEQCARLRLQNEEIRRQYADRNGLVEEERRIAAELAALKKDGSDGLETKEDEGDEMCPASGQRVGDRGRVAPRKVAEPVGRTRQRFQHGVRGAHRNQFDIQKLIQI